MGFSNDSEKNGERSVVFDGYKFYIVRYMETYVSTVRLPVNRAHLSIIQILCVTHTASNLVLNLQFLSTSLGKTAEFM